MTLRTTHSMFSTHKTERTTRVVDMHCMVDKTKLKARENSDEPERQRERDETEKVRALTLVAVFSVT